jgi:hypothetical protein
MIVLLGFAMYFVATATDFVWARWGMAVADRKPRRAALYAMLIGCSGLLGWNAYHVSYWMAIPMIAGFGTGTYFTVLRDGSQTGQT